MELKSLNMIGWTFCGTPASKILLLALFDAGCFPFKLFSRSLLSGSIRLFMLLVNNLNDAFALPFFIKFLIFWIIVFILLLSLKEFSIVSPFMSSSISSPFFQKSKPILSRLLNRLLFLCFWMVSWEANLFCQWSLWIPILLKVNHKSKN